MTQRPEDPNCRNWFSPARFPGLTLPFSPFWSELPMRAVAGAIYRRALAGAR